MTDTALTVLEWTYEPINFFEESMSLSHEMGSIDVSSGRVRGEFPPSCFDEGESFRTSTHRFLESVFLAQQIQTHQAYTLMQSSIAREYPDGRRDYSISVHSAVMVMTAGTVDTVVRDADGNITSDSKAERLAQQEKFRIAVLQILPKDIALKRMLQSFRNALTDNDNLLVHLYEVRETLIAEYSQSKAAQDAVGVSNQDWSNFGRLANDNPLFEGRHRGKHANLRKATREESAWALGFCQRLIEGYVLARRIQIS